MLLASIFGGLGAALGWGVASFSAKLMVSKQGPYAMLFPIQATITVCVTIIYLTLVSYIDLRPNTLLLAFGASIIGNTAWFLYMKSFAVLPASIVATMGNLYALVPLIWRTVVVQIELSMGQWIGALVAVAGAMLMSLDLAEVRKKSKAIAIPGMGAAILFPFLFGCEILLMDTVSKTVGSFAAYWYQSIAGFFVVPFLLVVIGKLRETRLPRQIVPIGLNVAGSIVAFFLLYWGFVQGETAIVSVLSTFSPMVVAVLAYVFLRERLFRTQYLGIIVAITGLALLSL